MTAHTPASGRIDAAHERLLAALAAPANAPAVVVDAALQRRGDALGLILAQLLGSLSAAATLTRAPYNQRLTANGLAEIVERVVDQGVEAAERALAAMSKAYVHALPPIDYPGRLAGVEPGPRCGAQQGRTALFMADVTCPACLEQINATASPAASGGAS